MKAPQPRARRVWALFQRLPPQKIARCKKAALQRKESEGDTWFSPFLINFFPWQFSVCAGEICKKTRKKYLPKRTNYGILKYEFDIKSEKEKA